MKQKRKLAVGSVVTFVLAIVCAFVSSNMSRKAGLSFSASDAASAARSAAAWSAFSNVLFIWTGMCVIAGVVVDAVVEAARSARTTAL